MTEPKPDLAERVARKIVKIRSLKAWDALDRYYVITLFGQAQCGMSKEVAEEKLPEWIAYVARQLRKAGVKGK